MTEKHLIRLPKRNGWALVTKEKSRIVVELGFDRYGDFGDSDELQKWLKPILEQFESDARPTYMKHPTSGETALIYGDKNHFVAIFKKGEQ